MKIYEPLVANGYEWINTQDDADYEVFLTFNGESRATGWRPIRVHRVPADDQDAGKPSDFPWLGNHALVMRQAAIDNLRDLLDEHGEVLPLETDDDVKLYVFNARTVDALDEPHSSLIKFPNSDKIMLIQKAAFRLSAVEGVDIFRLPHRASPTYVSERFVERVDSAGLRGLDLRPVWPT